VVDNPFLDAVKVTVFAPRLAQLYDVLDKLKLGVPQLSVQPLSIVAVVVVPKPDFELK